MRKRGTEMTTWLVGAYTADMGGDAEGILALSSREDGSLEVLGLSTPANSPSFLALDGDRVLAVEESDAALVEFSHDGEFTLTRRMDAPAGGSEPCHIGVYDEAIVVSCYSNGELGVHSRAPLALSHTLEASGSGPHAAQDSAHAHSTARLSSGLIVSADLGSDRLRVHELAQGTLTRVASVELPAGTGPRDIRELSDGTVVVLGELASTVLFLAQNESALTIEEIVAIPGAEEGDHAAGLSVSVSENFLYSTLRGSNRIGIIDLSDRSGVTWVSSEGDWPRHHAIDGDVLHVANQKSSSVASFRLDGGGIPRLIADPTAVPSPTHLLKLH